jgi:hypothetical protein
MQLDVLVAGDALDLDIACENADNEIDFFGTCTVIVRSLRGPPVIRSSQELLQRPKRAFISPRVATLFSAHVDANPVFIAADDLNLRGANM